MLHENVLLSPPLVTRDAGSGLSSTGLSASPDPPRTSCFVSIRRTGAGTLADNGEVGVQGGQLPQGGDFTAYVRARQGSLIRFARFVTSDPDLAKDLVQDALLKAYLHWDRICELESPDAYVRRIIVNQHTSVWRTLWRRHEVTNSRLVELSAGPCVEPPPHDPDLWAPIVKLSPMQRATVVLYYYEGLSEAEIAQYFGCSIGSVKTHLSRALRRLRSTLDEDDLAPRRAAHESG